MKITKVTPIFKSGTTNYRPIFVLSCFSKILERIKYNRVYNYLNDNNLLFRKQFGFRKGHSTDHALIKLIDSIYDSFNQNKSNSINPLVVKASKNCVDCKIFLTKFAKTLRKSFDEFPSYLEFNIFRQSSESRTDGQEPPLCLCLCILYFDLA